MTTSVVEGSKRLKSSLQGASGRAWDQGGNPNVATEKVTQEFEQRFGAPPALVVRAPGRVNLIGEHTDYNDGFVLPIAIGRAVWIALRPRRDRQVVVHSLNFDQGRAFSLVAMRDEGAGWAEYIRGVAWALQEAGYTLQGLKRRSRRELGKAW